MNGGAESKFSMQDINRALLKKAPPLLMKLKLIEKQLEDARVKGEEAIEKKKQEKLQKHGVSSYSLTQSMYYCT